MSHTDQSVPHISLLSFLIWETVVTLCLKQKFGTRKGLILLLSHCLTCHRRHEKALQEIDITWSKKSSLFMGFMSRIRIEFRKHLKVFSFIEHTCLHGGLLCIAFCLFVHDQTKIQIGHKVTGPKFRLDKKSLDQNSEWTKSHWTKLDVGDKERQIQKSFFWGIVQLHALTDVLSSTSSCIFGYHVESMMVINVHLLFFSWQ